ncbi:hypothetical protein LTR27_004101 [Elasticomyces elasticus]|nr:hypothetical protein LTR27_004101 [Elasticomyces elasticus]
MQKRKASSPERTANKKPRQLLGAHLTSAVSATSPGRGGEALEAVSRSTEIVRAVLPTPLRLAHHIWVPWHDGCFYGARITAVLPNQAFEFRYDKSLATIRLPLKYVRPNYHTEGTIDELVTTNSNAGQCYLGRLVLALCKKLGAFIPGHIIEFQRADRTPPWQLERVTIKFIHLQDITEIVTCSNLKTMTPTSATKLNAKSQPFYPRLHQTHHPSFAKLAMVSDPHQSIPSVKKEGTFVFARWPESNHHQLGVIVQREPGGDEARIPVLFLQDPDRNDIKEEVFASVEEHFVMIAPQLPCPPQYPKEHDRKLVGSALQRYQDKEKEWRVKHLFEDAEISEGQWVSANWRKSKERYESDYFVLGQIRKHNDRGYHVEIMGRGPKTLSVILRRDDIRPLYHGGAVVFTRSGATVWPTVVYKKPEVKKPAYGRLEPWQTRILPEQDVPTLTYAEKHEGRYVTKSAWTDVFSLAMLKKGRTDAPAVHAQTRHDLVGTLDASDPNFLVVFTPDQQHSYAKPIKVLIHGDFAVQWLKEESKGVKGIQVKVLHDGIPEIFTISVWKEDEEAAKRIVRRMMEKLKHASDFPEKYAGNSTGTDMVNEE